MKPVFHPELVNSPWEDSVLYIDCLFEKRALLFDMGELYRLPPKKILRITDAFVSHAHIDHFAGFDYILRICLGRPKDLNLYGPRGMIDRVAGKLAGYTWNLVENYATDFTIRVTEVLSEAEVAQAAFHCQEAFRRRDEGRAPLVNGVLLDEPRFQVRTAILDHKIPCLAFALLETAHVNIWKNRLAEAGLPVGAWLTELKRAICAGWPAQTPFTVWWMQQGVRQERVYPLGELQEALVHLSPGQKIAYVTDTQYNPQTAAKIIQLAQEADLLFIETPFLEEDRDQAHAKYHLTATEAGLLARTAQVRAVIPFHFSPRYAGAYARLEAELQQAFEDGAPGIPAGSAGQAAASR